MSFLIFWVITLFLLISVIVSYNNFVKMKNMVKEAFSTMDVYLKKRWDLVPNLVEVVKSYAKHEKTTLEKITELRSVAYNQISDKQKLNMNTQLNKELANLMIVVENYPELRANENFLELNEQLVQIEEDIADSRKYYNAVVKEYNTMIECFPSSIIANLFHFKKYKMFEIDELHRANVKVN